MEGVRKACQPSRAAACRDLRLQPRHHHPASCSRQLKPSGKGLASSKPAFGAFLGLIERLLLHAKQLQLQRPRHTFGMDHHLLGRFCVPARSLPFLCYSNLVDQLTMFRFRRPGDPKQCMQLQANVLSLPLMVMLSSGLFIKTSTQVTPHGAAACCVTLSTCSLF